MMSVKAFVSHASEDKERFVVGFATRLRGRGIDAWVDQWEIKPGDSLVQKIFTEGLDTSDVVIAVLSSFSIHKRWVREELDASVVNRIQRDAKIIPIVLDGLADAEIPQALRAILHVKIKNLHDYDAAFDQVVGAIYGHSDRPPLGDPPTYVRTKVDLVPGLNQTDSLVFKVFCEHAVTSGMFGQFHPAPNDMSPYGMSMETTYESLDMLDSLHYIDAVRTISGIVSAFSITTWGFEQYARAYVPDYERIVERAALYAANHENAESHDLAAALEVPHLVACQALAVLEQRGLLTLGLGASAVVTAERSHGRSWGRRVVRVSPQLRRMFRDRG